MKIKDNTATRVLNDNIRHYGCLIFAEWDFGAHGRSPTRDIRPTDFGISLTALDLTLKRAARRAQSLGQRSCSPQLLQEVLQDAFCTLILTKIHY